MLAEDHCPPSSPSFTPESTLLNLRLQHIIAALCSQDQPEACTLANQLKEIDCTRITYNQLFGLQLIQKLSFVERQMAGLPGLGKMVGEKKIDLLVVFKNGFKDTERIKQIYQQA